MRYRFLEAIELIPVWSMGQRRQSLGKTNDRDKEKQTEHAEAVPQRTKPQMAQTPRIRERSEGCLGELSYRSVSFNLTLESRERRVGPTATRPYAHTSTRLYRSVHS